MRKSGQQSILTKAKRGTGVLTYQVNDASPLIGKSFYRLKLKDTTGRIQYSEERTVNIKDAPFEVRLGPNPAKTITTVNIIADYCGLAQIRVIDQNGSFLYSTSINLNAGLNLYDLPLNDRWPSGIYIVQVKMDGKVSNTKLTISK